MSVATALSWPHRVQVGAVIMGATISLSVEDRLRLGMRLAQSPEKVARAQ